MQTAALCGEILRRHIGRDHRPLAGLIGERAIHVVENANLDDGGQLGVGNRG